VLQLTSFARFSNAPSWSPDGSRIVYSMLSDGSDPWQPFCYCSANLWQVRADGLGTPQFLFGLPGWDAHPAWSPDGTRLAFVSDWQAYDFVQDIYLLDTDDLKFTPLTGDLFDQLNYLHPSWSPDGRKIAVTMSREVSIDHYWAAIATMNPDGTGLTQLAGGAAWTSSSWSPDGSLIVFTSGDTGHPAVFAVQRHVTWVAADGSATGVLVTNGWSPDWTR